LSGHQTVVVQLAVGLLIGSSVAAGSTATFLTLPGLGGARDLARRLLDSARLTTSDVVLVAVVAGVGEELLFRGTLQPLLGLWGTSLLFALLHSGLPRSRGRAAYALFVFAAGTGLGVLYRESGLAAAMSAHAVVDLIFLLSARWALLDRKTGRGNPIAASD
jgi:membrane protease YdiL (CAAX protease family)